MIDIHLDQNEMAILSRTIAGRGGFQDLMKLLRQRAAVRNGKLSLTADDILKIQKYAFYDGGGGYEARLKAIFERSLGPKLSGNISD